MNCTVSQIIELALDIEQQDSIDWTGLPLDKHAVYQMMASQVYEVYHEWQGDDMQAILLATITKLVVENFVLNLRLESNNQGE
jgi:hypothetical protein